MTSTASIMAFYPVTGIKDGIGSNGEIPLRREIDEWWSNGTRDPVIEKQKYLFTTALQILHDRPPVDKTTTQPSRLSYYQIAGTYTHNRAGR